MSTGFDERAAAWAAQFAGQGEDVLKAILVAAYESGRHDAIGDMRVRLAGKATVKGGRTAR